MADDLDADERFVIDTDPEDALRALLRAGPDTINAEQLAEKHGVNGLALRNMLRANPELAPDRERHDHYRIDPQTEERIISHPDFRELPGR